MLLRFFKAQVAVAAVAVSASTAAAIVCTPPASLQKPGKATSDYYLQVGKWFGDHHRYACAFAALRHAEKLNANSPQIEYLLGLSLYLSGQRSQAVEPLQHSVDLAPNELQPRVLLARVLNELRQTSRALQQWQAALQISPQSSEVLDGLSRSLIAEGDYDLAINVLLKARSPSEDLVLDLAQAYGKSGMIEQAADTLKPAVAANPDSFPLVKALATVYVIQRRLQDASELAGRFAKAHPVDFKAQKLYLRVLVTNNEIATAKPLARKLLASEPRDFEVLYLNGVLEREDGNLSDATKHLEEAVNIDPNHAECRYNLGLTLAELGDNRAAEKQLKQAIALGYAEPEAHFKLATVLKSLGESDQAQKELEISQQERQSSARRAVAGSKAADAAREFESGNTEKAVALYREAVEATPDDTLLCYKLALALDRAGDAASERKALEHAIAIDPTFALAQHQLGYLDSLSGNASAAEGHFRKALESAPGYTQAWVSLAAALAMQSRFGEAQDAVSSALRLDPQNAQALQLQNDLQSAQKPH